MRHATFHAITLLLVSASTTGCEREYYRETYTFEQVITRLDVDVDSDLTVEPSANGTTFVDVDVSCTMNTSKYEVSVSGDTLRVAFDCWQDSGGRIKIFAPSSVVVASLASDAGNVDVKDLEGQLAITADAGELRLANLRGQLTLRTDAGNISGTAMSDVCTAYADAGNITLKLLAPPLSLDVGTDAGDIWIDVPAGAYDIATELDAGSRSIASLTVDPTSPSKIKAKTDAGDVHIAGY
jgi:hypothetical protein